MESEKMRSMRSPHNPQEQEQEEQGGESCLSLCLCSLSLLGHNYVSGFLGAGNRNGGEQPFGRVATFGPVQYHVEKFHVVFFSSVFVCRLIFVSHSFCSCSFCPFFALSFFFLCFFFLFVCCSRVFLCFVCGCRHQINRSLRLVALLVFLFVFEACQVSSGE